MEITVISLLFFIQVPITIIFLVVCFNTLPDFKIVQHRMLATYISEKLVSICKEVATTYWTYSSEIFLYNLKKTMKNLSQQNLISQPRFEPSVSSGSS
jgi:hypothetical protein